MPAPMPVGWVDSVQGDLRSSLSPTSTGVVVVRGFAQPDDGGGGVFAWDSVSTAEDDGGTVVAVMASVPGRWMRQYSGPLDIRWFGARANHQEAADQNDTAIRKAIAAATPIGGVDAGRIYFPPGQWYFSKTLAITKDDSVVLCGPGGAGTWGSAGAYDHQSAKLLWVGDSAPMVEFASTMRCGIVGLMLDGGGTSSLGFRLHTTDAPAKGNFVQDVVITNLAPNGVGVHVGADPSLPVNHDLAFNKLERFWIVGGTIGVLQEGNQTVHMVYEDGVITDSSQYGMKFLGGDVNVSRCFLEAAPGASADVHVGVGASYARFVANTHETVCSTSYEFEPTTASRLRPTATLFLGVRVVFKRPTGRFIDFQQDGHLTLVSCTFDGYAAGHTPVVHVAPPMMGYADTGLVQEIGCRYLNGATIEVNPVAGAYTGFYHKPAVPPSHTPILGEHFVSGTRVTLHNSELLLQDNSSETPLGVRLSTYLGQLWITPTEPRTGAYLLVLDNGGIVASVNHAGGPGFYGTTTQPQAKPTVTGSRKDNPALADLLSKLESFGLIHDGTEI